MTPGSAIESPADAAFQRFGAGRPLIVATKAADGRILSANDGLAELYRTDTGTLAGRFDRDFVDVDAAACSRMADRDGACLESGRPLVSVDELVVGGQSRSVASLRFPHRDAQGRPVLLYAAIPLHARHPADEDLLAAVDKVRVLEAELEELEKGVAIDRLTGAYTRAHLATLARQELERRRRYAHPVSLAFVDVDGLKVVNDLRGHSAGDALLAEFVVQAKATCRSTDVVGRYGGDEFVLLFPNTPLALAEVVVSRLRDAMQARLARGTSALAASFGLVEARPDEVFDDLVARADAAMYDAKRRGGNRVAVRRDDEAASTVEAADPGFVRLVWNRAYECGDARVDAQHRGLFASANALLSAVAADRPRDEVQPLADRLTDEVAAHFEAEEALLRETGFPGAAQHAALHATLLQKTRALARDIRAGVLEPASLFSFLVYELIAGHLLRSDRAFFAHVQSRPRLPIVRP